MKIVFYSVVLNQHQAPVADELWELTVHQYAFVELINLGDSKGGIEDYSKRPYLIRAWENRESFQRAMELARTAECCVFGGVDALPFQKERMRMGLLSLDMGERWLKHGWKSLASPRLLKWLLAYYIGGWKNKPLYKLCMSGFAAKDHRLLGTFRGKCYKWGYITSVEVRASNKEQSIASVSPVSLMWCARFLKLKHAELPIFLASRLKKIGYKFHLDMYGDGTERGRAEQLAIELGLSVCTLSDAINNRGENTELQDIVFHGNVPNDMVRDAMKRSDIFLFTSDKYEGWGAVANESMSCGCAIVASDTIGSVPYLIREGINGYSFKAPATYSSADNPDLDALDSLTERVNSLLKDRQRMRDMQEQASETMQSIWNPHHAAQCLLQLVDDLQNGRDTSIAEGPCSKA